MLSNSGHSFTSMAKNVLNFHFVLRRSYLERYWPDLEDIVASSLDISELAQRIVRGPDAWIVQTLLVLRKYHGSAHKFSFGPEFETNKICLVHWDHLGSRVKPYRGMCVVALADRTSVHGADLIILQNPRCSQLARSVYIPHWPQPGIIPRSNRRGRQLQNVVYMGRLSSLPDGFRDPSLIAKLESHGYNLAIRDSDWTDYGNADVAVSFRDIEPERMNCKPASKLINAWSAGVPMICDDEPAFRDIRKSDSDYLVARGPDELLGALNRLRENSHLYDTMVGNGSLRSQAYTQERIASIWITTLTEEAEAYSRTLVARLGKVGVAARFLTYHTGYAFRRLVSLGTSK